MLDEGMLSDFMSCDFIASTVRPEALACFMPSTLRFLRA